MAATTSYSNTNTSTTGTNHSPRHSTATTATATDNNHPVSSPQSSRSARRVSQSAPWTQVVVRRDSESVPAATSSGAAIEPAVLVVSDLPPMADEESLENENGPVGNAGKKPAWNKPSNGAVEVGPVMGADSWPALSESARTSTKSSSDSLKSLSDGSSSVSVSQGTVTGTGTGTAASLSSQKQVSNSANPNPTPNHTIPMRQRSMKRNGANNSSNGGSSQLPGSQGPVGEVHLNSPSTGEHGQRSSQSRSADDHPQQQQRNSFRNRNGGPHSRGDGSYHHNYGGRRDQDRANQDWNSHRNFNGRDSHMQPQRVGQRFMRHPPPQPTTTPFVAPPPVRPFGGPMGFPEIGPQMYYVAAPPPEPLRGMPYVPTPIPHHALFLPAPDLQLHSKIVNQIDYYFSNENLIKDTFLRQNMDDQGWVPINLIAGFNKVLHLTDNIQLILDAVRNSNVVEVQGDKVRRRNDWMRWIMPTSVQFPNVSGPQSLGNSSHDMLATHVQSISLGEKTTSHSSARSQADVHTEAFLGRSLSGDLTSHSQLSSSEGSGEVSVQGGLDRASSKKFK